MAKNVTALAHTAITRNNVQRLDRQMRRRQRHNVPFSYAGTLAVATSTPWVPDEDVSLREVRALLGTAGTSNTVVTVYVNGVSAGTVTLGSGVTNNSASLSAALSADTDVVTVETTTAGTGAADLTVLLRVS